MIFDEFPTIYFNGIDNLIATARSNKVAVTLAVQDYSQLKKDYVSEQAEVMLKHCRQRDFWSGNRRHRKTIIRTIWQDQPGEGKYLYQ